MLTRGLLLVLVVAITRLSRGDETPPQLSEGRYAPSPNGKLCVFYTVPKLEIRDANTFAILTSIEQELPVEALRWTRDSQTLIVVYQIAHGSDAFTVHWDGGVWRDKPLYSVFEHPNYRAYAVVDVQPGLHTVDMTYKTYIPTQLVSFTVTPATGKFHKLRRQNISFERWKQLRQFPLNATNASNQAIQRTAGCPYAYIS